MRPAAEEIAASYTTQAQRLDALRVRWIDHLGLAHWWRITFVYQWEALPDNGAVGYGENSRSLARVSCDWRYGDAVISWCLAEVEDMADDALETAFVHELMHLVLNELRVTWGDEARAGLDHEERVATHLAHMFIRVREAVEGEQDAPVPAVSPSKG